tara:strand:- start:110 stop:364 length:255 start_codon:yes stop_codon:yes gene_type:complete
MQTIKVLVSGNANFMQHALALTTGYTVKSYLHETTTSEDDEWTEFAEYVLEGTRKSITEVEDMLEAIAQDIEAEELYGGELGEI